MANFAKSDRIVIKSGDQVIKELTAPDEIDAVITFFRQRPSRWAAISGVFPQYDLAVFDGATQIGEVGFSLGSPDGPSKSTINVGDYFQRVPTTSVAELARKMGVPWPPNSEAR